MSKPLAKKYGGTRTHNKQKISLPNKPLVSVITVVYNSVATVEDTIRSVIRQDYDNIEYIVIDGGSTDNTLNIIKKYEYGIDVLISEPDKGIYDAMNKGIKSSSGDIIGFLNSDDFYKDSTVISDVVNQFKFNPESSLIFGDVVFVDPLNSDKIVRFYNSRKFKAWKLRFGWMPPHPASFFKRSAYEQVGNFSLEYKIAADYELFVRMLLVHKLTFTRINKVLIRMRAGGLSTSGLKSSFLLNTEIVKACKRNGIYTNLFFVLLKIPFKILELLKRPKNIF